MGLYFQVDASDISVIIPDDDDEITAVVFHNTNATGEPANNSKEGDTPRKVPAEEYL